MNQEVPLHIAVQSDHLNCVEYLVNHGALMNAKNKDNKTPLEIAHEKGLKSIEEFLRNKGAQ